MEPIVEAKRTGTSGDACAPRLREMHGGIEYCRLYFVSSWTPPLFGCRTLVFRISWEHVCWHGIVYRSYHEAGTGQDIRGCLVDAVHASLLQLWCIQK